jgi:N-formylglutamate amidohydrolase
VSEGVEEDMQAEVDQGFAVFGTESPQVPVLVSVPHAGRDYPEEIFAALRLPRASLVRLEDRYADLLVRNVVADGAPVIIAHRARAWVDLNRDERDLDVEMVSGADRAQYPTPGAKQRGGLGLIPRRLSGEGDLWKGRFAIADVERRVSEFHRPYHAQITDILHRMRERFGTAILLDVHSMPPVSAANNGAAPRLVIGDRYGQSAGARLSELLIEQIRMRGFSVALNHPYSGDHILRRHGNIERNIHAIQIEVDRSLYLDSELREPGPGVAMVARLISDLVAVLADQASGHETLIAAE